MVAKDVGLNVRFLTAAGAGTGGIPEKRVSTVKEVSIREAGSYLDTLHAKESEEEPSEWTNKTGTGLGGSGGSIIVSVANANIHLIYTVGSLAVANTRRYANCYATCITQPIGGTSKRSLALKTRICVKTKYAINGPRLARGRATPKGKRKEDNHEHKRRCRCNVKRRGRDPLERACSPRAGDSRD